jgi:hypothetical protein
MTPIQLLLILLALLVLLLYFRRLRTRLVDRLVFIAIVSSGVTLIARPDWATVLAQRLGVGRGADLVAYLGLSGLGFLWLQLYTRQKALDERLTELARKMAILEAEEPGEK